MDRDRNSRESLPPSSLPPPPPAAEGARNQRGRTRNAQRAIMSDGAGASGTAPGTVEPQRRQQRRGQETAARVAVPVATRRLAPAQTKLRRRRQVTVVKRPLFDDKNPATLSTWLVQTKTSGDDLNSPAATEPAARYANAADAAPYATAVEPAARGADAAPFFILNCSRQQNSYLLIIVI